MTLLPVALSLSNTFTKVGAIAAFAGIFGIALLTLLVVSQSREIKRLREWSGRAPERAAEMEQRVAAAAAVQAAQPGAQRAPHQQPGTGAVQAVKPIPRAVPVTRRAERRASRLRADDRSAATAHRSPRR
jgi:hypothetical protein